MMNNWNTLLSFMASQNINSFLDIGANCGDFIRVIKNYFPNLKTFSIEANPKCESYLKRLNIPYKMCCLSDEVKDIDFFVSKLGDGKSTGASYYKEKTYFYEDDNFETLNLTSETLDDLFPNEQFDFIKIDVQGSEIDIIKGGMDLVQNSKFIMLEVSIIEYNENSPLIDEVFEFMSSINFKKTLKLDEHKNVDGKIFQEDWLFTKDTR